MQYCEAKNPISPKLLAPCVSQPPMTMFVIKIPNSWRWTQSWSLPFSIFPSSSSVVALFTIVSVLLATTTSTVAAASNLDDNLPVHKLRAAYELVQSKSWHLIEQQFASSAKLSDTVKGKIVKEVFAYHHRFIADELVEYERKNKDHSPTVFPEYNHFYEWNYVQGHINATNSLFDVFRQYLATNVDASSTGGVNALGARDFADTVLFDKKWPIEKSFNDIHNIMIGQGLYYKLATVQMYLMVMVIICFNTSQRRQRSCFQNLIAATSLKFIQLILCILRSQDSTDHVCRTQRSAQQVLYQMYTAVSLTELKGYAMMQFSWMLLRTYGVGNFTREADLMRQRFEGRTNKTHIMLQKVMVRADNTLFRCDPVKHEEGQTYERVTKLLQGYVENEVDMNTEETCRETCDHYQITESFTCFKELYCAKQPKCTGKVLYCQYLDSDMWICPSVSVKWGIIKLKFRALLSLLGI